VYWRARRLRKLIDAAAFCLFICNTVCSGAMEELGDQGEVVFALFVTDMGFHLREIAKFRFISSKHLHFHEIFVFSESFRKNIFKFWQIFLRKSAKNHMLLTRFVFFL
jgi:hypothetical protein